MMKTMSLIAIAMLSLAASPAFAKPSHPSNGDSKRAIAGQQSTGATGPTGAAGPKGKAYGYYCQNQSKKHTAEGKGTPFSRCVAAGAKLLKDQHE